MDDHFGEVTELSQVAANLALRLIEVSCPGSLTLHYQAEPENRSNYLINGFFSVAKIIQTKYVLPEKNTSLKH